MSGTRRPRTGRARFHRKAALGALLALGFGVTALPASLTAATPGDDGATVFSSNRASEENTPGVADDFDIYIARPDGAVTNLTANATFVSEEEGDTEPVPEPIEDLAPAFSPDGRRIAFTRNWDPADGTSDPDLYVMNTDGTGLVQLTANAPGHGGGRGAAEYEPAWSPDGTRIAYRQGDGLNADIWVIDVATKRTTRVTGLSGGASGPGQIDAEPAWSPDGNRIVFTTGKGPGAKLAVVDLASMAVADLIDAPDVSDASASFTPDGASVVFRRGDEGAGAAIWVHDLSGGAERRLTDPLAGAVTATAEGEEETPAYSDLTPVVSPSGASVVFVSTRPDQDHEQIAGDPDLYVIPITGGEATRLAASAPGLPPEPVEAAVPEDAGPGGDHGEPALPGADLAPDWQPIPRPATPAPVPAAAPSATPAPAAGTLATPLGVLGPWRVRPATVPSGYRLVKTGPASRYRGGWIAVPATYRADVRTRARILGPWVQRPARVPTGHRLVKTGPANTVGHGGWIAVAR